MYYILGVIVVIIMWFVYDKYVQRKHQLLTNYPIIGRMRYLFEALREPLRQYFADEEYYDSRDKLDWIYNASRGVANYSSFAPSQPLVFPKYMIKHSNIVLNNDEVENDFSVTFGENRAKPFVTKSVIGRSAMSDGSISPEGTRAFAIGAYSGGFPINTGEGGLTSNFLVTHSNYSKDYMEHKKHVSDGPKTAGMPKEAPGNVGSWVGWQIVNQYMKNSKGKVSLKQLLKTDPKTIMAKSKYKPK